MSLAAAAAVQGLNVTAALGENADESGIALAEGYKDHANQDAQRRVCLVVQWKEGMHHRIVGALQAG